MPEKVFESIFKNGFMEVCAHIPTGYTIVRASDAIAILIEVPGKGMLLVRQARPAVITEENPEGMLTEVVAGRFDCDLSPVALAIKEAEEEVGVTVTEDQIRLLNGGKPLAVGPGLISDKIYLAYVKIRPDQMVEGKEEFGLLGEHEHTVRVFIPVEKLEETQFEDLKTYAVVQWFLKERAEEEAL